MGLALALVLYASPAPGACPRTCAGEVAACKRTECVGRTGADRRQCLARCRGRGGCGGGVGTLAYVVSKCRVEGGAQIGTQELRVRRNGCDPVTVARFANPAPVPDILGLCALVARNHVGSASPLAGVFQRVMVSRDGTGVVFEVSNRFQLAGRVDLAPEQQGFFYVRADGTGLRRLGPPTRNPPYRIFIDEFGQPAASVHNGMSFSTDDRWVAYPDVGPGPDGVETEQVFAIDLETGQRRQLTRLAHTSPPPPANALVQYLTFVSPNVLQFRDAVGSDYTWRLVTINGADLGTIGTVSGLPAGVEGRLPQPFKVSRPRVNIVDLSLPGTPENVATFPQGTIRETFRVVGKQLVQLTNFRRAETRPVAVRPRDVLVFASGDTLGTNPHQNCQVFRVSPFGAGLRQLTHFDAGRVSEAGCQLSPLPGCGIEPINQEALSHDFAFYSDCDPFGTNPDGGQVFAVGWDGSRLRQLTHASGARRSADGALEVDIPGPIARGGR